MATRPRNIEETAEGGSRTALRENPVQPINIYRRVAAAPLIRHTSAPAHRMAPDTMIESHGLRRPSVQPATSPPIKRISASPSAAKVAARPAQRASSVPAAIASRSSQGSAIGSAGLSMPTGTGQPMTAAVPSQGLSSSTSALPLPSTPRVALAPPTMQGGTGASSSVWRRSFLAAVPGFFGLMGLSQISQGRKLVGFSFLASGALLSFLSSWYLIILGRLDAFFFKGAQLSPYALSYLSSVGGNSAVGSKLAFDLLGVLVVVWGLSVYDALGSVFTARRSASATALQGQGTSQKVSMPQIGPMRSTSQQGAQAVVKDSAPSIGKATAPLVINSK
jgi:hypothetical protein